MSNRMMSLLRENVERGAGSLLRGVGPVEAVVGVPFFNEVDSLLNVVCTARQGLVDAGLGVVGWVVLVGPVGGGELLAGVLSHCPEEGPPVVGVLLDHQLTGRGWSAMALMEISGRTGAKLILLSPKLEAQPEGQDAVGKGFASHWIGRLYDAVTRNDIDLALARFSHSPLAHPVESILASPLITGVLGCRIRQPMPGALAISSRLGNACVDVGGQWSNECGMFGFDAWLTAYAALKGFPIGEVNLGLASFRHEAGMLKLLFRHTASALLSLLVKQRSRWLNRTPVTRQPFIIGSVVDEEPPEMPLDVATIFHRFRSEFDHFDDTLFFHAVPDDLRSRMERWADGTSDLVGFSAEQWADVVRRFTVAYAFPSRAHPSDIIDGLFPLFLARLLDMAAFSNGRASLRTQGRSRDHVDLTEAALARQAEAFVNGWPEFQDSWRDQQFARGSYLPRLGAWEFIPNVDIVVPQEIKRKDGKPVWAFQVYQKLLQARREEYRRFVNDELHLEDAADSAAVLGGVKAFMGKLEGAVSRLFPHGLHTPLGAVRMTETAIAEFADGECFQLTPAAAHEILLKAPPSNLLQHLGCASVGKLLETTEANDVMAMAAWTDRQSFMDRVLDVIHKSATPAWFHRSELKTVPLAISFIDTFEEVRASAALLRLSGRLVAASHLQSQHGEWPTLWFLLKTMKRIASIEMFSELWEDLAREKREFSKQLVASIRGHWGRRMLSAHNVFSNQQQRRVQERLRAFAKRTAAHPDRVDDARVIDVASDIYPVSITLPDTTFVPLCAWTWCSFSARGGTGWPTPLSSLVERDWASSDFLVGYLEASGLGDALRVSRSIATLMKQGRESEDLGERLLGVVADSEEMLAIQSADADPPPSGRLVRPVRGPILEPVEEHDWESRYVLNAAALRLDNMIYILYRAFGHDKVSRIGLAWTRDGIHMDGRLDEPIFVPDGPSEVAGCEDPRITVIGDRLYMLYTAYDGKLPQIAMASISKGDFVNRRFSGWQRHGLGFPGVPNKDAVLYPEKFGGKFAVYHRIDPAMWVSFSESLDCPWPRTGHKIVVGPRSGMMWDGIKIGAGAQPIKTTKGWLNIYHGVDYEKVYRLGVLLMDPEDPSKVLYQSPNPILEPEIDFEIGKTGGGDFWVPRVVFTCGAVLGRETDIAEMDDEVYVYYGAADTAIGVAKARIGDLLPG